MSKGSVFVVACSFGIILSFVLSCYLLTTVDPPKLDVSEVVEQKGKSNTEAERIKASNPRRVLDSLAPFYRYAPANVTSSPGTTENAIFILPYTVKVSPPIYPPWASPSTKQNKEINEDNTTINVNETTNKSSPVKGRRRSINNYENNITDRYSGIVILKVMDDNDHPRIEIKINSVGTPGDEISPKKSDSNLRMYVLRNNIEDYIGVLGQSTEIKIMSNDTVVIDSKNKYLENKTVLINDNLKKGQNTAYEVNHVSNIIQWEVKPTSKASMSLNYFKHNNLNIVTDPIVKESKVQNDTDAEQNKKFSFNDIAEKVTKEYNLEHTTENKSIPGSALNIIKAINNTTNESKTHVHENNKKTTCVTKCNNNTVDEDSTKYTESGTRGDNLILNVLFDNKTKSFTESYEVETTVKSGNVAITKL